MSAGLQQEHGTVEEYIIYLKWIIKLAKKKTVNKSIENTKSFLNTYIPTDWDVVELGKLGKFSKGKGILKEQVVESGLPCIRYGEIYTTHDFIIQKFNSHINQEVARESQEIKKGDILFAGSGETLADIGKAVAFIGNEKAYAGGDIIILSPNEKVISECLVYVFEIDIVRKQKRKLGQGNSVVHIYSSDLSKIKLPLPPLTEQKAISRILSTWDHAIQNYQQLVAQRELRKKWLMQQLLTGKKRLKGFNREWTKIKLEKVAEIRRGASPRPITDQKWFSEKGRGWIRISDVTNSHFYLNRTTQYLSDEGADKSVKVNKGDLIMSICATIGVPVIVNIPACIHDGFVLFRKYEKSLTTFFLYYYIQFITKKLSGEGQPGTQKNLNTTIVGNIDLNLPTIDEQAAISKVLQLADKETEFLNKKLEQLKIQKKGLMQVLLTGKNRAV
jgi:type I restriction enzyme S subunit